MTSTSPIEPAYALPDFGEPLVAYAGRASMADGAEVTLRIWSPLRHSAKIHWTAEGDYDWDLVIHQATLIEGPHAGMKVDLWTHDTAGVGSVSGAELNPNLMLDRVVSHWINVPPIYVLDRLEKGESFWRGRLAVEACGWDFTLDARQDLFEIDRRMISDIDEFVVSYVGELRRSDGSEFSSSQASSALEAFGHAMSFSLGHWVAPAYPVGYNSEGHRCWERWAPWRCDRLHGFESWIPKFREDDVRDFVQQFVEHYLVPADQPVVRHVARHVIAANTTRSTIEARLMVAQAALEYLSWIDLVLSGSLSRKDYKELSAAERVRRLLQAARIPATVPPELDALKQVSGPEEDDGPGRMAWVRNRIVHPKDADEPYRIEDLVWQATVLTIEYAELLLLNRIGYNGHYMRRYPPGRDSGSHAPVPWVQTPGP